MGWKNIFERKESAKIVYLLDEKEYSQLELFEKINIPLKERSNFKQRHLDKLLKKHIIYEKKDKYDKRKKIYKINLYGLVNFLIEDIYIENMLMPLLYGKNGEFINKHIWISLKNKLIGQCVIAKSLNEARHLVLLNDVSDVLISLIKE